MSVQSASHPLYKSEAVFGSLAFVLWERIVYIKIETADLSIEFFHPIRVHFTPINQKMLLI